MLLDKCVEIAKEHNLNTVGEAILNAHKSAFSLFHQDEITVELMELNEDFVKWRNLGTICNDTTLDDFLEFHEMMSSMEREELRADDPCMYCSCFDHDTGGCTMPSVDRSYACGCVESDPDDYMDVVDNNTMPKKPLILILGRGEIGVSTGHNLADGKREELVIWKPQSVGGIGDHLAVKEGTTTRDIPVYVRLIFENTASVQVVIDALERIKNSLMEDSE